MMRRTRIAAATVMVAAGLVGAVAAPASAQTEYQFKLFEKQSFQGVPDEPEPGDRFRFKGKLFDPQNRDNRVGSDRGKCTIKPRDKLKCEGTFHLDGEIGGVGDIEYRGTIGPGDQTFKVVGGSDDFEGATGEVGFRNLNESGTKTMNKYDFVVP
jgi:hypothetical protein